MKLTGKIILISSIIVGVIITFYIVYNYFVGDVIIDGVLIKEEYEARDPNTGELIAYFIITKSSLDESDAALTLTFQGADRNLYYVAMLSVDSPDSWMVSRDRDFKDIIPIKKID